MEFDDVLRLRRSVKRFDPEHRLDDEDLKRLFAAVALTPSSFNMQNWHFVAVRDPEVKERLCAAAWNQPQVKEAALVVVLAGRLEAWRDYARYLRKAPAEVRDNLAGMIRGFYEGKDELAMQEACRSVGLAGMTMMLAARNLGWESCPMIGYDPIKVAEIVGLPAECPPLMMVTIGRGSAPPRPRMGLLDFEEFVSLDAFGRGGLSGEVDDR
ncbi:MAG: nitroreductase family protein [Planctomycetota bacterium]